METKVKGEYNIDTACPVCFLDVGNTALSRIDNKTKICRYCAITEAKDPIGTKITKEEMIRNGHLNYRCYLKERKQE